MKKWLLVLLTLLMFGSAALAEERIPTVMSHEDMTICENYTTAGLGSITTDVGTLYGGDVTVEIADESIATFDGFFFTCYKTGLTEVTLTAKTGGASTTFTLTVLPADDTLYVLNDGKKEIGYLFDVPYGYTVTMPTIVDYYGNVVKVTWALTETAGSPYGVPFKIKGDKLTCLEPSGVGILIGTAKNGATVKAQAHAFRLSREIRFWQESFTVRAGDHVQTDVYSVDMADGLGEITWTVGDESIIRFDERFQATGMPTVTGLKAGTTTLTATLINGVKATCTITVTGKLRLAGDANEDDAVNLDDAMAVLDYLAGTGSISNRNADVTGDAWVDVRDALLLLQYCAGWGVTLQ